MRIKFPESRRNWHDIYRDPMEERLFCFNDGPSGGDEPDGVTFTSGDDYVPGQGIQISSSTLAPGSETDTYRGRNTSDAALGALAAADPFAAGAGTSPSTNQAMMDRASGGNDFSRAPSVAPPAAAPGALANLSFNPNVGFGEFDEIDFGGTGPRPQADVTVRPDVPSNLMNVFPGVLGNSIFQGSRGRNEPIDRNVALTALQDRAVAGDLSAQKELDDLGRQGAITFAEASYPQIQQQKAMDAAGIARAQGATAQNVLGGGISTLDPFESGTGYDPTLGPMQGPPRMPDQVYDFDTRPTSRSSFVSGVGNTPEFGISRPDIVDDEFTAVPNPNITRASYDPSVQDEEQTSAISDNFLDERGRRDVGILGKQIAEYFDSPVVQAGQKLEGFSPVGTLVRGLTGQPSLFTDKAGLPSFGSLGDMTKAVQAGGRLTTDESGNPLFVTMPDGSTVGGTTQASSLMTGGGGGGGGSATAQKSPTDPCPPGYKMVDGVCQPDGTSTDGSGTVTGDTRFSPFYTPVEVGKISPFILQPYTNES